MHVVHPLLKPGVVEFRGYQANLARIAQAKDTLVVLPTGLGKTVVATLVMADALRGGARRVLLLAPTRPLVEQHGRSLAGALAPPHDGRVAVLTGDQAPDERASRYESSSVVCATPQVVHNDLLGGRLDATLFDWVVFDEAHRATGDYAYVFIGTELRQRHPAARRLGLTASPGHDMRRVDEVRHSLGLAHVEIRTPADPDVAPYVQSVGVDWEVLPLPPSMARVSKKLQEALADRVKQLRGWGLLQQSGSRPTRRTLLEVGRNVQARVKSNPEPDPALFTALSVQAQAIKLLHAIEQVETQGAAAFVSYLEDLREEAGAAGASKASQSVAGDARVNEAYHVARFDDSENPKLGRTGTLVQQQLESKPDARIIVFTHYRGTCDTVVAHLARLPGVRPIAFVGQSKKGDQAGMTQKQQAEAVQRFKEGAHNVLVATSVAEEGLDIPEVDLVVFYEPIGSEIRAIQRRGRTGRRRAGRVVVLMNKGTQDEAAHWSARRKEQEMVRELGALRGALASPGRLPPPLPGGQTTLSGPAPPPPQAEAKAPPSPAPPGPSAEHSPGHPPPGPASAAESLPPMPPPGPSLLPGPRILVDHRETAGGVARHLHALGARLDFRTLDSADFVLSDRVAAERKTCRDFVDSLVDGRLFDQLRELKRYPRPFLLLEGETLHGLRNVSPEAVMGALASITVDHGIPVIQTRDPLDTARFLHAVARREQTRADRKMAVRPGKPSMTDRERQLYVLCGLPGVSDTLAERLLAAFGSLDRVLNAPVTELAQVEGIGPGKASEMRHILSMAWTPERRPRPAAERTETV